LFPVACITSNLRIAIIVEMLICYLVSNWKQNQMRETTGHGIFMQTSNRRDATTTARVLRYWKCQFSLCVYVVGHNLISLLTNIDWLILAFISLLFSLSLPLSLSYSFAFTKTSKTRNEKMSNGHFAFYLSLFISI